MSLQMKIINGLIRLALLVLHVFEGRVQELVYIPIAYTYIGVTINQV